MNVKVIGINSKNVPCNKIIEDFVKVNKIQLIPEKYGIITETNSYIESIVDRFENLKLINP